MRKAPQERYGSVRALIDDLDCWLQHRPVSARREGWRHRTGLWLRRNALPAALAAGTVLTLMGGLAASNWQWRRAQAAALQSQRVTAYLTDLLGSANPDAHGGQWPNVLQLPEKSRGEIDSRFADEPDVLVSLLDVLATTYNDLNRYDLAKPLARQWADLAAARYGDDDARTVLARLKLAEIDVPLGPWDAVVAQLEALRPRVANAFGPGSEEMRRLLVSLATGHTKTGRLDSAESMLRQAGELTEQRFPEGHFERAFIRNHFSVLYTAQGRLRDALAELRLTEPYQHNASPDKRRFALVLRRNTLAMQIRVADYDRIEERLLALGEEMDRLLGPGNAMRRSMHAEMARYHTDRGDFARALVEREAMLANGKDGPGGSIPATQATQRAARLLARCLAQAGSPGERRLEAQGVLADIDAARQNLGSTRFDAWLLVARAVLVLGDTALAGDVLGRLKSDPAWKQVQEDAALASRVAQTEGEWLRSSGNLAASRDRLALRVDQLARSPDHDVPPIWMARLDLAYTLVLMRDPQAPSALDLAARARPPKMPADHPMDAVQAYLHVLWLDPSPGSGAVATARDAVERAFGRMPGTGSPLPQTLAGIF